MFHRFKLYFLRKPILTRCLTYPSTTEARILNAVVSQMKWTTFEGPSTPTELGLWAFHGGLDIHVNVNRVGNSTNIYG